MRIYSPIINRAENYPEDARHTTIDLFQQGFWSYTLCMVGVISEFHKEVDSLRDKIKILGSHMGEGPRRW